MASGTATGRMTKPSGTQMRFPRLAGFLETDLKSLIAGILSRPYRGSKARPRGAAAVAGEIPAAALMAEIGALPSSQRLVDSGEFHVYCARATQILPRTPSPVCVFQAMQKPAR